MDVQLSRDLAARPVDPVHPIQAWRDRTDTHNEGCVESELILFVARLGPEARWPLPAPARLI